MPLLESLLGSVRGFCTDLGTEMSLADVSGIKLESILPAWISDYGLQSEEGANAALTDFVFPNAVFCPGVLHVCHNMSLEADSSLTFWKAWLPGYKAVSTLLHHDHLRKQLIGPVYQGDTVRMDGGSLCSRSSKTSYLEMEYSGQLAPNYSLTQACLANCLGPKPLSRVRQASGHVHVFQLTGFNLVNSTSVLVVVYAFVLWCVCVCAR